MIGFILDAMRAGTSTARRKRPDPMQMLSICLLSLENRDDVMIICICLYFLASTLWYFKIEELMSIYLQCKFSVENTC